MTTAARRRLMAFDWPGNVRQLKNAIESMVVVDMDGVLDIDDLPDELSPSGEQHGRRRGRAWARPSWLANRFRKSKGMFIAETLEFTNGNREETAGMLGIGERTLYRKIKEYGL